MDALHNINAKENSPIFLRMQVTVTKNGSEHGKGEGDEDAGCVNKGEGTPGETGYH